MIVNDVPKKFAFHCQKVLPLVYDDSLSYMEVLCKVSAKLNEIIEYVDSVQESFLAQANAYTDNKFGDVLREFEAYKRELNQMISGLDGKYEQFVTTVNARMNIAEANIRDIANRVDSAIEVANAYTNQAIINNNEYIISETTKALETVKVVNYFTGERISVQDMFDYLAQFHLENAISYNQLATRDKTYNQLIAYNMTYTQLALNGGTIIQ